MAAKPAKSIKKKQDNNYRSQYIKTEFSGTITPFTFTEYIEMNNKKSSLWPTTKSHYEIAVNKQCKKRKQDEIHSKKKQSVQSTTASKKKVVQSAPKKAKITKQEIAPKKIPGTQLTIAHVLQFLKNVSNQNSQDYPVAPFVMREFNFSLLKYLEYLTPSLLETNRSPLSDQRVPVGSATLFKKPHQRKQNPFKDLLHTLQEDLIVNVLSFLDFKSIGLVSRASKSLNVMIGRHFEFITEGISHFHFHPSKAADMDLLIKNNNVKYLTGRGIPFERVLNSSQSLQYLELKFAHIQALQNTPRISYPNLTHLKLFGTRVNFHGNIECQPIFHRLTGLSIEYPYERFLRKVNVEVLNIMMAVPSTLECLKGMNKLKQLKIANCSRVGKSLGPYLNHCHSLEVLHLGYLENAFGLGISSIKELAIRNSKVKLTDLISDTSLGKQLKVLDLRGTVWTDSEFIYSDYKKLSRSTTKEKDEVILNMLLSWMTPSKEDISNNVNQDILKIILTDAEFYFYGISASGKGFEWWTRYTTVVELFQSLRKSYLIPQQFTNSTLIQTSKSFSTVKPKIY